jgi:hypothetical protein
MFPAESRSALVKYSSINSKMQVSGTDSQNPLPIALKEGWIQFLGFTDHHERRRLLPVLFRETFPLISEDFSFKGPEESLGNNYVYSKRVRFEPF